VKVSSSALHGINLDLMAFAVVDVRAVLGGWQVVALSSTLPFLQFW
jgi:hypothetical protein